MLRHSIPPCMDLTHFCQVVMGWGETGPQKWMMQLIGKMMQQTETQHTEMLLLLKSARRMLRAVVQDHPLGNTSRLPRVRRSKGWFGPAKKTERASTREKSTLGRSCWGDAPPRIPALFRRAGWEGSDKGPHSWRGREKTDASTTCLPFSSCSGVGSSMTTRGRCWMYCTNVHTWCQLAGEPFKRRVLSRGAINERRLEHTRAHTHACTKKVHKYYLS